MTMEKDCYREALRRIDTAITNRSIELDLGGLQLTSLPAEMESLTGLHKLFLCHNQLDTLPEILYSLTRLERLDLQRNRFRYVSDRIAGFESLRALDLSHNQLKSIPAELGSLQSLRYLHLNDNLLTTIPPEVGELAELHWLDLSNNQLTHLPTELQRLVTSLRRLYLHDNPDLGLSEVVLGSRWCDDRDGRRLGIPAYIFNSYFGDPVSRPNPSPSVRPTSVIQKIENYYAGNQQVWHDDHSINIGGNVINSQVGQVLNKCTNIVEQQAPGEKKDLLEKLKREVEELITRLPEDKIDEAGQVADSLEVALKQATSDKPNRKWYSLSTEGLLEAAKWVKDFSGEIGGTLKNLGTMIWPDFNLPKID